VSTNTQTGLSVLSVVGVLRLGEWTSACRYIAHGALISSRGVITLFLWSLGTRPVKSCCGLRIIRNTTAADVDADTLLFQGPDGLDDTHTILRQELLFYAKLGITVSVKHAGKQRGRRTSGGASVCACVRLRACVCVRACVRCRLRLHA
jgi:hypothetical protein